MQNCELCKTLLRFVMWLCCYLDTTCIAWFQASLLGSLYLPTPWGKEHQMFFWINSKTWKTNLWICNIEILYQKKVIQIYFFKIPNKFHHLKNTILKKENTIFFNPDTKIHVADTKNMILIQEIFYLITLFSNNNIPMLGIQRCFHFLIRPTAF